MKEFKKLKKIIDKLRSPKGCPWDKKQTHKSLLPYLFEESNEVYDAVIKNDQNHLKEELGDLLLQILLHAKISEEKKEFDIKDVINNISDKLIRRHPHVFGEKSVNNADEVVILWDEIKKHEKKNKKKESVLDDVPSNFTPLLRSFELQKKAAKVGFDWENYNPVLDKINEELNELIDEIESNNKNNIEHEIGDLLFAVINLSRKLDINPITALMRVNLRFIERFKFVEKKVKESGKDIKKCNIDELEKYWQESKIEKE